MLHLHALSNSNRDAWIPTAMEHLLRVNNSAAPPVMRASRLPKVYSDKSFMNYKYTYAAAVCATGLDGAASTASTQGKAFG